MVRSSAALLVPVKAFTDAKVRLSGVLSPEQRRQLARGMAEAVLKAARGLPVTVVCDDAEVAEWASAQGAEVVWAPQRGLNAAVALGVEHLAAAGADLVTVAHADLPLVTDLSGLAEVGKVVLAPDRRHDGTNVAGVPASVGFCFSYGPGSFRRHCDEATRLGLEVQVVERSDLAWDVDVPADLSYLTAEARW
jgi:2-phospho-L-lactate guanylyltransferase